MKLQSQKPLNTKRNNMPKLKELATIVKNNIQNRDLTEIGDLKFVNPKQLINENQIDWNSCLLISSDNKKVKGLVSKGDIVIVNTGVKCGQIYLHTDDIPFVTGMFFYIVKPNSSDLLERIIGKLKNVDGIIKKGNLKHLNFKDLGELEIN